MASVQRGRLDELERSSEGEDDEHFVGETGSGETIARLGLTHSHSDTLSFNAALEGAYNFLDGDSRLRENGDDVPLPGSDVRIRERRGEASLGAPWSPADDWTIQPGTRIDRHELHQTADPPLPPASTHSTP